MSFEAPQDWYFTFGVGHEQSGCYVKIHGTWAEARDEMFKRYGARWSMQYDSALAAGVERWNLKEVQ